MSTSRETLKLDIRWTQTGDEIEGRRGVLLALVIPVGGGSPKDRVLDKPEELAGPLIALVESAREPVVLEGEREALTVEDVEAAVAMANTTTEARHQEEREKRTAMLLQYVESDGERYCSWKGTNPPPTVLPPDAELLADNPEALEALQTILARKAEERKTSEEAARLTRVREEAANCARRQREAETQDEREAEQSAWIEEHGSDRLRGQIDLEYEGWPLYLHERLAMELPGAELHEDAEAWDEVKSPTEEQLQQERDVRETLRGLGENYANRIEAGYNETAWRWEPGDEWDDPDNGTPVLVVRGYQPGQSDGWRTYTVVYR